MLLSLSEHIGLHPSLEFGVVYINRMIETQLKLPLEAVTEPVPVGQNSYEAVTVVVARPLLEKQAASCGATVVG